MSSPLPRAEFDRARTWSATRMEGRTPCLWARVSPRRLIPSCPLARSPAWRGGIVPADVKICGLTRSVDAEFADAAGAAYLGVIFAGGARERAPAEARATLAGRRARK